MSCVFITGANRGLGLEFVRQYAGEGWRVIAAVREPERADELKAVAGKIETHRLDVTDFAAVAGLAETLHDEAIDVVIANAGVMGPRAMSPTAIDAEAWGQVFRVNAMAPLAVAASLAPHLGRGTMRKAIAITSRLGSIAENNDGGLYAYRSSKAALNAAWKSFAIDHPELIATVLHPGWVQTDMGGSAAPLVPVDSVSGMRQVIAKLSREDSGRFYAYDGAPLPW